jgi:hypothetical protein
MLTDNKKLGSEVISEIVSSWLGYHFKFKYSPFDGTDHIKVTEDVLLDLEERLQSLGTLYGIAKDLVAKELK